MLHVTDGAETLGQLFHVVGDGHRPPRSLWYMMILAALAVYFLDIATRKLPPSEQWLGRLRWRLPLSQRMATGRQPMASTSGRDGGGASMPAGGHGSQRAVGSRPQGELYVARLRPRSRAGESGKR
jgi:hypothetical protein